LHIYFTQCKGRQLNHLAIAAAAAAAVLQVLNITAPLVVLDEPSRQGYGGIKLCLLDTPGPNEAGEEGLKYQVRFPSLEVLEVLGLRPWV
jgi:hypothetical protein